MSIAGESPSPAKRIKLSNATCTVGDADECPATEVAESLFVTTRVPPTPCPSQTSVDTNADDVDESLSPDDHVVFPPAADEVVLKRVHTRPSEQPLPSWIAAMLSCDSWSIEGATYVLSNCTLHEYIGDHLTPGTHVDRVIICLQTLTMKFEQIVSLNCGDGTETTCIHTHVPFSIRLHKDKARVI